MDSGNGQRREPDGDIASRRRGRVVGHPELLVDGASVERRSNRGCRPRPEGGRFDARHSRRRVTNDGRPFGAGLRITWSKVAGPGTVSFSDIHALSTTVTFGAPVLRASSHRRRWPVRRCGRGGRHRWCRARHHVHARGQSSVARARTVGCATARRVGWRNRDDGVQSRDRYADGLQTQPILGAPGSRPDDVWVLRDASRSQGGARRRLGLRPPGRPSGRFTPSRTRR